MNKKDNKSEECKNKWKVEEESWETTKSKLSSE